MKTRIVATALIRKDNKYIFIRKKGEKILHIPGGAIEDNENIISALKREILEECNIQIDKIQPVDFVVSKKNHDGVVSQTVYLRFVAEFKSGELSAGDDAAEIYAIPAEEILRFEHNPNTIQLLRKLKII